MRTKLLCLMLCISLLLVGCSKDDSLEIKEDITGPEVDLGEIIDQGVPLSGAPVILMNTAVASGIAVEKNSSATIDYSNTKDGYVMVAWNAGGTSKLKVQVKGPSGTVYTYDLKNDGTYEIFPLSDGNGKYQVIVYKNTVDTKYATMLSVSMDVSLSDEFAPFIRPNQYVNYNENSKAVAKAAELCVNKTTNLDKVQAVYDFVIGNIVYDTEKASTVQSGYLPDIDLVLETKKGICFDYASLMSAMLRSQNVPVKLIVGYTGTAYHAWINVWSETDGWVDGLIYFNGSEWKLMDPTFAASSNQNSKVMEYIGNGSNYTAKYLY